jgi:thiamine kinase-like enzyme
MLIDYEYACFNFIGFDIINYCIESFFDLEHPSYPFYSKLKDVKILFEDEKYFEVYKKYINQLINNEQDAINISKIKSKLTTKEYFISVVGLAGLFWFICSMIPIEFTPQKDKSKFDYLKYSLDRLSVYIEAIKTK